jgi:pimeloyl-ACP methyl ester carboxylesterase
MIRRRSAGAGIVLIALLGSCAGLPGARLQESFPPPPWSGWMDVWGARVHYVDTDPQGPTEALLIVHGFLGSTIPFELFIEDIRAGRRVVMPDLPGCGLSPAPDGDSSLESYLDFLEAFSLQLGLERIALMGSSQGAQLGVRYAARHGGQVSCLILSSPFGLAAQQDRAGPLARCEALLRLAAPWVTRGRVRRGLLNAVADDSVIDARILESYWAPFRTAAGRRAASQQLSRIAMRQPLDPELARLSLPVLILFGEEDPLNPPQSYARYQELAPSARVVVLSGLGHLPYLEAPGEVARRIEDFLIREGR